MHFVHTYIYVRYEVLGALGMNTVSLDADTAVRLEGRIFGCTRFYYIRQVFLTFFKNISQSIVKFFSFFNLKLFLANERLESENSLLNTWIIQIIIVISKLIYVTYSKCFLVCVYLDESKMHIFGVWVELD